MKSQILLIMTLLTLTITACGGGISETDAQATANAAIVAALQAQSPETIEVTRIIMERETVLVEVTRIVTERETVVVTSEVKVTREVPVTVEVEVERIVTATPPPPTPTPPPTDTPEPTDTPIPQIPTATAPPPDMTSTVLQAMRDTREQIEVYGGLIDEALRVGYINCQSVVDQYDNVAAAPTYDVSTSTDLVKDAYNNYRSAVQIFLSGARDMTENCRNYLTNPTGGGVPRQQWGLARQQVNEALAILIPAIESLEK